MPSNNKQVEGLKDKFHEHFGNVYEYEQEHTDWWISQISILLTEARKEERERIVANLEQIKKLTIEGGGYGSPSGQELMKMHLDTIQEIADVISQDFPTLTTNKK